MPDELQKTAVTIDGKEYTISPLRLKYLREISEMVSKPVTASAYASIERFFKYITLSIQEKHPEFKSETIDECTADQAIAIWTDVLNLSGIRIISKPGEIKPVAANS